ncbi:unnamed protein product [Rhizophagus irregularis]|nr:unnamed protein product [Rhizophagus irregularis]CAB5363466.1 unnamed protein product [Rhizophagus irregularis]
MNFQYITIAKRLYPNIKTFRAILYLELKIKCKICCAILQGPIELSTYTSEISKVKKECSQGGSVVNALLATGHYKIRALTRNPNSDKAKALKAKGVDEVVKCDLSNKEDIKNALSGADIAWIVTNYWDPLIIGVNPGEEERQGKLIADAAKEVGFNWLIYSFLPDSTTESDGKYPAIINL